MAEGPSARDLFMQGSAAYRVGSYEEAVRLWEQAYGMDPRPLLLYNLGQAYERLGRLAEAVDFTSRYLDQASPTDRHRADATARLASMRERLSRTGIQIDSDVEGAVIMVDGEDRGRTPRRDRIQVEPGHHSVVIRHEGFETYRSSVTVTAGTVATIPVELIPIGGPEVAEVDEPGTEVIRPLGAWITIGAGGAMLVTGVALWGVANGKSGDATYGDDGDAQQARNMAVAGDVMFFAGVAAAAGGVLWLFLGAEEVESDPATAGHWDIRPVLGRGIVGADAQVRF